ncbi:ScbR family autoregulator-binding transcription factor [Streptomyces xanthochromogenes]|uniref:ScbR family autoregulator-binding transcription factor n=1 Tax=Streptomyces xanthochromogenes TaxID=67384 RepID=UPI0034387B00
MARQERALRTRNALIESAAELFDRDGFETASLATISARAGVSNGALHFHFASKAALAEAVREAAAQRLARITDGGAERGDGGALQMLIDTSHALVRGFGQDVVLRAGFDLGDGRGSTGTGADLCTRWRDWVEAAFARAAREGALAPDASARDATLAVVGAVAGFKALGGRDPEWLSPDTLTRFWSLLLPRVAQELTLGGLVAAGTAAGKEVLWF